MMKSNISVEELDKWWSSLSPEDKYRLFKLAKAINIILKAKKQSIQDLLLLIQDMRLLTDDPGALKRLSEIEQEAKKSLETLQKLEKSIRIYTPENICLDEDET